MRKTVVALMLILPLLFVFVIFSSVNIASLGVQIAASGIRIVNKSEFSGGTVHIDLAGKNETKLEVEVMPENASNKGYTFEIEQIEGSDFADVSVSDGKITASSEGAARIFAVSNDGAYKDSVDVIVGSSKAYDFEFTLTDSSGEEVELRVDENGNYFADIDTGVFFYDTRIIPSTFSSFRVECGPDLRIDRASRSILVPFGGESAFKVIVPDGVNGDIVKTVTLTANRAGSISVNGSSRGATVSAEKDARSVSFFVEANSRPTVRNLYGFNGIVESEAEIAEVGGRTNCYIVTVPIAEGVSNEFSIEISADGYSVTVTVSFMEYDFFITSDMPSSGGVVTMLVGQKADFFVSASVYGEEYTYHWFVDGPIEQSVSCVPSEDGTSATLSSDVSGSFKLGVQAYKNNKPSVYREITVNVVKRVYGIQLTGDELPASALVDKYTIGGYRYDENGKQVECTHLIDVRTSYSADGESVAEIDAEEIEFSVSDYTKARLSLSDGKIYLTPLGTGEVTVSFAWKSNDAFGVKIAAARTYNIANNAVEVNNSPDLMRAAEKGNEIVVTDNIMLGTDSSGEVLPEAQRIEMLASKEHRHKSTYNIEWYKHSNDEAAGEDNAYLMHVVEFKDNVYGNGFYLNAENFTCVLEGTNDQPKAGFFRRPLYFVKLGEIASVAGQDNCAFLVRNDKVKLYGVNLLGCDDERLLENGEYKLTKLNSVGTVLEINGDDVEILNCRIRNGRNVVRVYGGNKNGGSYFINSLEGYSGCESERIDVRIAGCILSQGREFILKIGANKALKASSGVTGNVEPDLLDASGRPYLPQTNDYIDDEYFRKHYVMTDVTLEDSVLETSGLFSVGIETNFSGTMLYSETDDGNFTVGWPGTGGTSFASILRLVGDVRMYDWKDISLVDSSSLIEIGGSGGDFGKMLTLNIREMINFVQKSKPAEFADIIESVDGKQFVHGGIALYGGGKNYSQISLDGLNEELCDLTSYKINIGVLAESDDQTLKSQGETLPNAAGKQDFRFFMYGANSRNNYEKQLLDGNNGTKYSGVKSQKAF